MRCNTSSASGLVHETKPGLTVSHFWTIVDSIDSLSSLFGFFSHPHCIN